MGELHNWCELGYQYIQECDQAFSEWFTVPRSIKTTSIKPSGTVSLLAGATPGIHFPESRCVMGGDTAHTQRPRPAYV
jgi:ribonucleoside-triphosphate reductase (thioredoxin)